jgi:hypothetical protein
MFDNTPSGDSSGNGACIGEIDYAWVNNGSQGPPPFLGGGAWNGLCLIDVAAFVNESTFNAWDILAWSSATGGHGIDVGPRTTAFIAECGAHGGRGGRGYELSCSIWFRGGDGGNGINVAVGSDAQIVSRHGHLVKGGDGGPGIRVDPECEDPAGGDGGDGIESLPTQPRVSYSGVVFEGGQGGSGDPPGRDGVPINGNVVEWPTLLPTSTMSGDGKPGSVVTFEFHGDKGDRLLIAYSTELDVIPLATTEGQPLQTSPSGRFGMLSGGTIPPGGTSSFSFQIPADTPVGEAFFVQGILLGAHPPQLTNMSMLVTTPDW